MPTTGVGNWCHVMGHAMGHTVVTPVSTHRAYSRRPGPEAALLPQPPWSRPGCMPVSGDHWQRAGVITATGIAGTTGTSNQGSLPAPLMPALSFTTGTGATTHARHSVG